MARKKPNAVVQQVESRAERKARQYGQKRRDSPEQQAPSASNPPELPQLSAGTDRAEAYLQADDKHFINFRDQLASLGLMLRDIPGDGNCLFRALSDQLDGHMSNHMLLRMNTVRYMIANRDDFEPFMDSPFECYVDKLARAGTYAGQDVLVAFARRYQVNIIIHQLNSPTWKIEGAANCTREVHLSYHNGEHYSSVRRIGDTAPNTPANVQISHTMQPYVPCCKACTQPNSLSQTTDALMPHKPFYTQKITASRAFGDSETNDTDAESGTEGLLRSQDVAMASACASAAEDTNDELQQLMVQRVMDCTRCYDIELVQQVLLQNGFNEELSVDYLLQFSAVNMAQAQAEQPNDMRKSKSASPKPAEPMTNKTKQAKASTKKLSNKERKEAQRKAKLDGKDKSVTTENLANTTGEEAPPSEPVINHLGMLNL